MGQEIVTTLQCPVYTDSIQDDRGKQGELLRQFIAQFEQLLERWLPLHPFPIMLIPKIAFLMGKGYHRALKSKIQEGFSWALQPTLSSNRRGEGSLGADDKQ